MKASMKHYRVRSSLRWAMKLCAGCCVLLGGVVFAVLPVVHGQARYLIAATVAALAVQAIGLMLVVTACMIGPALANWYIRIKHLSRYRYPGNDDRTTDHMNRPQEMSPATT